KRADLFPLAICQSGVYDVSVVGWGERGEAVYFNNPLDYVSHLHGDHLEWLRSHVSLLLICGQGAWEDTTGALESTKHFAGLLGTEEDWPTAFESLVGRLGEVTYGGETHRLVSERITNEPFNLRYEPRYSLVIDRLAWWYHLPREWLKKIALMDDVYLLNNPFTFQAMEKHAAYCAMMRLGFAVPDTWLLPHKVPPQGGKWEAAASRFEEVASRYNAPFDLGWIAEQIGYPLYMKPFDGGQWIGVTRIGGPDELHARYDESGERLMH